MTPLLKALKLVKSKCDCVHRFCTKGMFRPYQIDTLVFGFCFWKSGASERIFYVYKKKSSIIWWRERMFYYYYYFFYYCKVKVWRCEWYIFHSQNIHRWTIWGFLYRTCRNNYVKFSRTIWQCVCFVILTFYCLNFMLYGQYGTLNMKQILSVVCWWCGSTLLFFYS